MKVGRLVAAAGSLLLATSCGTESADSSAASGGGEKLDCPASEQISVDLDVPGPGTSTPEQAVAPFTVGSTAVVEETQRTATLHVVGSDGAVVKVFDLTRHNDGWWPDSYTECAG